MHAPNMVHAFGRFCEQACTIITHYLTLDAGGDANASSSSSARAAASYRALAGDGGQRLA